MKFRPQPGASVPSSDLPLQQRRASANRRLLILLGLLALAFYAGFIVMMAIR
ncbi:MAG: hypothetical protein U1F68_21290 [Gammaproteobacteria bacterium]